MNDITRGLQVLALPLAEDCCWDSARPGATVQDYLLALLTHLVVDRTGGNVSEYGMTGASDWQYDLYRPLATAGFIPAWEDGWGVGYHPGDRTHHPEDARTADQLITDAIAALPHAGQPAR